MKISNHNIPAYKHPKKWVKFIKKFSPDEYKMNSFNYSEELLLGIYKMFSTLVADGYYLELGCGSGILVKFICLFSRNNIFPFGVDYNPEAIKLAKKNNSKFSENFICEDYFKLLKSNSYNFERFSTINIFTYLTDNGGRKIIEALIPVIKRCKKTNFIITDYDYDFFQIKDRGVVNIINTLKKIAPTSIAGHSTLVISENKKIHLLAKAHAIRSK